ncbi:MAG: DNA-binding protein [Desulfovibrionales bacterium]|nr:DNA-binding protein [Desulfovibrionales bacterium]
MLKNNISGPYFNLKEAASYVGYHPDSFRRLIKEFNFAIPCCGPKRNRYAKSVLDQFMAAPFSFVASPVRKTQTTLIEI